MAKIFCKYHPDIPARWVCRHCQINFCTTCIAGEDNRLPECPVCHREVESLGTGNVIKPFWQRLPAFFLYPAHLAPLLFILALAAIDLLLGLTTFGILIQLALFVVFMKYAYVVLEHTAQGYLEPPSITWDALSEELELPFKQLFVVFLLIVLNSQLYSWGGSGLLFVGQVLTALLFPASVMVLAVEHNFFSAINPLTLSGVIRRIGTPYLLLWVFIYVLMSGVMEITYYLSMYLPADFYKPMSNFLSMYLTLVVFHIMGYVLYQYHEELGFSIEQEYEEAEGQPGTPTAPGLREVEILFHEGKVDEARQRLLGLIKEHPGNMQYRELLHRLMLNTGDKDGLRTYSSDYIVRLMLNDRPSEAQRVFTDCYKVDQGLKFGNARQRHSMAQLLYKNGQARAALALLNNLHGDFPAYEAIPDAYLLVAKILCEDFNQDAKARQVLEFLQQKYSSHPSMPQVMEYMAMMDALGK
ncbi:MAG: hypothetical protein LJE74_08770 [Proteobacteria bacterium]|jgi:hypothetical protein|nr:hypothetical protein [Pseudomonadota bacterium]